MNSENKKPCLIGQDRSSRKWLAWNEDGALIAHSEDFELLSLALETLYYEQVPPNSRLAATIRDKLVDKARRKGWI